MKELLPFDEDITITFSQKQISLPSDLRPIYKMSQILLMFNFNGNRKRLSLLQIQYLNWLLKHKDEVKNINLKKDSLPFDIIHLDSTVNKAIDYCLGEKLIDILDTGKFELSSKGKVFVNEITRAKVLKDDLKILKNIGSRKVSEKNIEKMIVGK